RSHRPFRPPRPSGRRPRLLVASVLARRRHLRGPGATDPRLGIVELRHQPPQARHRHPSGQHTPDPGRRGRAIRPHRRHRDRGLRALAGHGRQRRRRPAHVARRERSGVRPRPGDRSVGPPAPHASRTARGVGPRRPLAAPGADPRCRPRRRAVAARAARPALTPGGRPLSSAASARPVVAAGAARPALPPGGRPLSIAASALLVVAAAVLATLIGRAMLGRLIPAARAAESEPTAHAVLEAIAALYGVLVAFVLAGAWDRL